LIPPTASSLGEYANFQVNLYTGVLPVNIPLCILSGRGINLPINANYHAKGIRVGETASWIGLGWSLDAGGVITRSVRGLPDEEIGGYLETRTNYSNPADLTSSPNISTAAIEQGFAMLGNLKIVRLKPKPN
jgi:hypothetical protein